MSPLMTHIGVVGLGLMGSRVVKRLLGLGYSVAGYNRTAERAEPLTREGMQWRATPREVAEFADITISLVSGSQALASIAEGSNGVVAGLSTGKIYVDMSTVSPKLSEHLARAVAATGARMLDAPVSGSVPAVEAGSLAFFVGGEAEALERARPVLEQLGSKILHVGRNGQGAAMKLAINLNLPVQLQSLFEGLLLAEGVGIPRGIALDALLTSVIASPAMKYRAPFIVNKPKEIWFSVAMMLKDLTLAKEMAAEQGLPLAGI